MTPIALLLTLTIKFLTYTVTRHTVAVRLHADERACSAQVLLVNQDYMRASSFQLLESRTVQVEWRDVPSGVYALEGRTFTCAGRALRDSQMRVWVP